VINVELTKGHPIPYDAVDAETKTFKDELVITANTLDLLEELGAGPDVDPETARAEKNLIQNALKTQNKKAMQSVSTAAYAAREFIKEYANQVAADVNEVRSAITTKLLALANCGDPKFELKAIELLGKHSDIALFTERSEITINHKSSADLEAAIKERVKRLLNADVVDVTPLMDDLDAELAATEEPEFTEVEDETGTADTK
jgi:seryl-tRNA synthetase